MHALGLVVLVAIALVIWFSPRLLRRWQRDMPDEKRRANVRRAVHEAHVRDGLGRQPRYCWICRRLEDVEADER